MNKLLAEYASRYEADALLIRDAMLDRLPAGTRQEFIDLMFSHPTNQFGIDMIANYLETLAKQME